MSYEQLLQLSQGLNLLIVAALGASIGSFLNVVIYRIPAGISLIYPPSRCPVCLHRLGATENIPILGWLRLQGRCAHCQTPISARYPIIEGATSGLFLLAFGLQGSQWSIELVRDWVFLSWLLSLAMIDYDTMTLPNPLTQWGVVTGLGLNVTIATLATAGQATPDAAWILGQTIFHSVLGAMVGLWGLDTIRAIGSWAFGKEAMGAGDAKLMAGIGAWLGTPAVVLTAFLGCLIGAIVGISAISSGRISRSQPIPFGPFLAIGGAVSLLWGEALIAAYWQYLIGL